MKDFGANAYRFSIGWPRISPNAAILLYTLAPDLLIGWPRPNRAEECEYMLPDVCTRPEVGRITGRGNTASLEVVLALKPDLILDVGATAPTFISLASRVQEQTGIPYALLDGRFDSIVPTYRTPGALTHRSEGAESLAQYAEDTMTTIKGRIVRIHGRPLSDRAVRSVQRDSQQAQRTPS
jgi:iron complex transport system substrate-binding protein